MARDLRSGSGYALRGLPRPRSPTGSGSGSPHDAGAVYAPSLDARQYVALCVELAAQVAARQEILRRYQAPNEAARRALEKEWRRRPLP